VWIYHSERYGFERERSTHARAEDSWASIVFNLPAVLIVALVTWVLVRGIRESAGFNSAMVVLKLVIIGLFVAVALSISNRGIGYLSRQTGLPGSRLPEPAFSSLTLDSTRFRRPPRNAKSAKGHAIGIIASLILCTIIYIAVALVLTGMVKWDQFSGVADPLAKAFSLRGMNWTAGLISFARSLRRLPY